jgi:hypothetical protein
MAAIGRKAAIHSLPLPFFASKTELVLQCNKLSNRERKNTNIFNTMARESKDALSARNFLNNVIFSNS